MKKGVKDAMIRLAIADGHVAPDFDAHAPGRGGYLHRSVQCLERFAASKAKEFRSLKRRIERGERVEIARVIKERLDRETQVE
jgi:predicted RNA-binding protein YlxR (DUF448 family)